VRPEDSSGVSCGASPVTSSRSNALAWDSSNIGEQWTNDGECGMGLGDPRNGEYYYCTTFSKEITSTWMRYLDYCFNKPTLPSPLETLEILWLVVVTLTWWLIIRKGVRGDRFFGLQSITAIFPLKNEHSFSLPFSARCTLNWDYGAISWASNALQQPCIMDSLLYYLFAWPHSKVSEVSRRFARACLVSIYRWQAPILFRF